jgi:hypothetical protein
LEMALPIVLPSEQFTKTPNPCRKVNMKNPFSNQLTTWLWIHLLDQSLKVKNMCSYCRQLSTMLLKEWYTKLTSETSEVCSTALSQIARNSSF